MESPQKCSSFKNLVGTIESLLGSKSDLTVTWAQSVKLIIEDLSNSSCPSTPCTPSFTEDPIHDNEKSRLEGELILLKAAYALSNVNRKVALNRLLDIKGNIRVFCRVRPLLPTEQRARAGLISIDVSNGVQVSSSGKARSYKFDKVFQPASLQDDVFSEVEPLIRSAMDGNNVCIFAYGQTGTGKTFTMEGSRDCPGIVPRTLQQLFFDAKLDTTVKYSFKLSMLEVYRGSLRDLLVSRQQMKDHPNKSLCIQMAVPGCIEIENLTELSISSASQAGYLYRKGIRARSTSWTTANESSSRSHCLVRITITCSYGKERHVSKLWLIDLGGSERFFKTQAQGQTLEEGKAINASLSALGDVISALQRKQKHIPYRNSKLTQILRDCLGKDSKALMLVHVSPKEEDLGETMCSLGFASRARGIHLGKETTSPSARDERTIIMADVLKQMKMYEDECQKLHDNIQVIESLIRNKREIHKQNDAAEDLNELRIRLMNSEPAEKLLLSHEKSDSGAALLPRFMTPTVSSKGKRRVHVENVVSFMMEATEKRIQQDSKTRQVRRTLNFQIVSSESQGHEVDDENHEKAEKEGGNSSSEKPSVAERRLKKITTTTTNAVSSSSSRLNSKAKPAWEEFGKKSSKVRRRWTLECSSKISITKHSR